MWYFIIGALLGLAQLILRNPLRFFYANHPVQGALASSVLGAAVYGTILWMIGSLVF
jgi:hypothetical protein